MIEPSTARHSLRRLVVATLALFAILALVRLDLVTPAVWVWLACSAVYVGVELQGDARPGPGWIAWVAMGAALDLGAALLGMVATTAALGMVNLARRRPEPFRRIVTHLPPGLVVLAVVGEFGLTPVTVIAGGAVAGMVARLLGHVVTAPLGRRVGGRTTELAAPYVETGLLGIGAGLMGFMVAEIGPLAVLPAMVGLALLATVALSAVDLGKATHDTVRSLLTALEAKDLYTRGHAERVAAYAVYTGEELGLSGGRLEALGTAALLHDIGKVVSPRHLLRKPGRLTSAEYCRIQHHAEVVPEVLGGLHFLAPVVPIISEHHVHFDGSGYGAETGSELSLEARILAVADSYDAMTTHRPYRRALTRDYAFAELRRCAGTQFDPAVVEAFITCLVRRELHPAAVGAASDEAARHEAEELAHV